MKKLFSIIIFSFLYSISTAQTQKTAAVNEIRCKTFTVNLGCCGVVVTTEITVCCGCAAYGNCGCNISKSSTAMPYDGYTTVDDLLKNKGITGKTLTVTQSNTVADQATGLLYSVVPGDYNIIDGDNGHKLIVVKVAIQ